jgi:hypothetical protein
VKLFPKFKIFIASKADELKQEREFLSIICDYLGFESHRAPEESHAGANIREYLETLQQSNVMVLVLGDVPSEYVDEEITEARRCGIPILPFFKINQDSKISTAAEKFKAKYPMEFGGDFSTLSELKAKFEYALSRIINSFFITDNGLEHWSQDVYDKARLLIVQANWRILIIERTSSLILGPRIGQLKQESFTEAIWEKIQNLTKKKIDYELCYLFNAKETRKCVDDVKKYNQFEKYFKKFRLFIEEHSHDQRILMEATKENITSAMVGDYSYGMSLEVASRVYTFGYNQHKISNSLFEVGKSLAIKSNGQLNEFIRSVQ